METESESPLLITIDIIVDAFVRSSSAELDLRILELGVLDPANA